MERQPSQALDIRRYTQLLYRRRYPAISAALAIVTAAVVAASVLPPAYEAKTVVLIQRNFINQLIKDIAVTPSTEERLKALAVVMKSRALLLKVMEDLGLEPGGMAPEKIEKLVGGLQKKTDINLDITRASRRDMDAFAVSFRDRDPQFAMNYVNALVGRYIEENATSGREEASGANRFLADQINFFKKKIDAVEAQIAGLDGARSATLQGRLATLNKRWEELSAQYTAQHPDVVKVKAEIEDLREKIRRGSGKAGASGATTKESAGTGDRSKKVADLERERDAYKKIYQELIATLGKAEVSTHAEAQDPAGAFRIVDPAVLPTRPVGPDRLKIALLGLFGGIAGGIGLALFLDSQDDSIRTVDALKELGVPVLAIIPRVQSPRQILVNRRKDVLVYGLSGVYLLLILTLFALTTPG